MSAYWGLYYPILCYFCQYWGPILPYFVKLAVNWVFFCHFGELLGSYFVKYVQIRPNQRILLIFKKKSKLVKIHAEIIGWSLFGCKMGPSCSYFVKMSPNKLVFDHILLARVFCKTKLQQKRAPTSSSRCVFYPPKCPRAYVARR